MRHARRNYFSHGKVVKTYLHYDGQHNRNDITIDTFSLAEARQEHLLHPDVVILANGCGCGCKVSRQFLNIILFDCCFLSLSVYHLYIFPIIQVHYVITINIIVQYTMVQIFTSVTVTLDAITKIIVKLYQVYIVKLYSNQK